MAGVIQSIQRALDDLFPHKGLQARPWYVRGTRSGVGYGARCGVRCGSTILRPAVVPYPHIGGTRDVEGWQVRRVVSGAIDEMGTFADEQDAIRAFVLTVAMDLVRQHFEAEIAQEGDWSWQSASAEYFRDSSELAPKGETP